jgi:hypothetical protein
MLSLLLLALVVLARRLVTVDVANLLRGNRARLSLMFNVAILGAVAAAGGGCNRGKTQQAKGADPALAVAPAPASSSDPNAHIFEKTKWIDSCMKSCRRSAPGRLPSLSAADREQHCSISCACGLVHMTDPGPGPGQVHAPSVRWQSETEDQHQAGVKACLDRATAEVAASHAHPG